MKHKLRFVTVDCQRRMNFLPHKFCLEKLAGLFRPPEFVSSSTNRNKLLVTFLLLFIASAIAQEQTPPTEFPIGSHFGSGNRTTEALYERYAESGMNIIEQYAADSTRSYISGYNLNALNMDREEDFIYHYSSSYYSKWEAEQDVDTPYVGVKHKDGYGQQVSVGDTVCWSSIGMSSPGDSLLFGPHYHQEKWYRRWLYAKKDTLKMNGIYDVRYIPRYRMALNITDTTIGLNEDVCRIYVMVRHGREINGVGDIVRDDTLKAPKTLKVSDFPANGQFDYFYFSDTPSERWYRYPEEYQTPVDYYNRQHHTEEGIVWVDIYGNNGVEFRVEWLRSDAKCTLYVDYVEVYDDYGWRNYIENPIATSNDIKAYADSFRTLEWFNIMHWVGVDEPFTIDACIPIRTVDSLLRDIGAPPLLVHVYPYWNVEINKDSQLVRYYKTAKPDPLNIHFFPFLADYPSPRFDDWEAFRTQLQISYSLTREKGFWYKVQNFGLDIGNNQWLVWRQPNPSEQNAEIMLALAHGVKGLGISHFDSYPSDYQQGIPYILQGLIKDDAPAFTRTELFNYFRDSIIPRLKGKLGNTLLNLDYTGAFARIVKEPIQPEGDFPSTIDYLELSSDEPYYHFHAGLLKRKGTIDDKYFLLVNLKGTTFVTFTVTNNFGYNNLRIKFVEDPEILDVTTNNQYSTEIPMPHGEGYLFEVAPVVKYGGKLIYPESTQPGMILEDDMIIESGAVLTVNGVYSSEGNITIKNGGIINGDNGKIQFAPGKKLIVEGSGSITGTANNKLELVFSEPVNDDPTGILIKANGSLTISNCKIENATIGINSLLNTNYLNAQNIEFINCADYSINIVGRSPGMNPTPSPQIYNCLIQNSDFGISVTNLPGMLIQENTITNTAYGIYLSNVTDAQVIANIIESNREEMVGIYCQSSGGVIRANIITGHTSGIHLANSSPKLGGNTITSNKYHGLYIGAGSLPFMRGEYVGDPPNMYALSGYNEIMENGGYQEIGGPPDNDGSEIYFFNSNAQMDRGCNSIVDDRQVSPPLINTLLLMNGYSSGFPIIVQAQNNFWGDTVYAARFGNLTVNYVPYESVPCPVPQEGGEEELVLRTSFGEVIDTVYSTGEEVTELSVTELAYAEAEEYFLTGDLTSALQIYEGIINSTATEEEKYLAYQIKYSIGKLTGQSTEYFNQLSNTFMALASNTQDTLSKKILSQFSTLSKVGEQEYETAIGEFDNIVQQNPNTEEAVYAEIDALTTSLLIEEADSTLQKGRLGKYLIKSTSDYNQKIDEILRKHFGSESKENQKELLPTEYTLYQNYPNPFNPVTTIKYDLPNTSDVSLIIYDILGRKIKELVNTKQQAGRYEVQFNASNVASGVYIYQLIAKKYINAKKMILLR